MVLFEKCDEIADLDGARPMDTVWTPRNYEKHLHQEASRKSLQGGEKDNTCKYYLICFVYCGTRFSILGQKLCCYVIMLSSNKSVSIHPEFNRNFVNRSLGDPFYLKFRFPRPF